MHTHTLQASAGCEDNVCSDPPHTPTMWDKESHGEQRQGDRPAKMPSKLSPVTETQEFLMVSLTPPYSLCLAFILPSQVPAFSGAVASSQMDFAHSCL